MKTYMLHLFIFSSFKLLTTRRFKKLPCEIMPFFSTASNEFPGCFKMFLFLPSSLGNMVIFTECGTSVCHQFL